MQFSADYRVNSHGTDLNGCASVSAIMQYIQETASLQHFTYGPQLDDLRRNGKAFILSRVSLDCHCPIHANDRITVETWLSSVKGYGFMRNSVMSMNGRSVAEMVALWGAIDIATRQPLRIESIPLGFGCYDKELVTSSPLRFRIPAEVELRSLGEHTVVYSDCDRNMHLNNTHYPAVFCDKLEMRGKRVSSLSINYMHESPLGSHLDILSSTDDRVRYFRAVRDDNRICTEAVIDFSTDI